MTFFAGLHRGFAPPRTKIAINGDGDNLQLDAELSWNYEAGIRFGGQRAVSGEFSYFRLDFSNQVITAAESGGATTTLVNGGASLHEGLESSLRVNWNELADLGRWSLYTDVRHMRLSTAQFRENELYGGNRLPYAPRNTFGLIAGLRRANGPGIQLDLNSIGDRFGDRNETFMPSADGTIGLLPAYSVTNLIVDYEIRCERWSFSPTSRSRTCSTSSISLRGRRKAFSRGCSGRSTSASRSVSDGFPKTAPGHLRVSAA